MATNVIWPTYTQEDLEPTGDIVNDQVEHWRSAGTLISRSVANEVASWYQSPTGYGHDFAVFASTGNITDDLVEAIQDEILSSDGEVKDELFALLEFILSCWVTPWTVGHNTVGYLPESDVYMTLTHDTAVSAFKDELERYRDYIDQGDCECENDELCENCIESAYVDSFITDEVEAVRPNKSLSFYTDHASDVLQTHYWIDYMPAMSMKEYFEERETSLV